MRPARRRPVVLGAAALALAAAVGIPACGGENDPTIPDTASVTPADAPLFGDAVVHPEGDQRETLDEALSKLLNTDDPGGFIVEQLDTALQDADAGVTYSEDLEPWLGEHAGLFFTSFSEPDGALVVEVAEQAAAAEAVDKMQAAEQSEIRDESYNGVDYELDEDETAVGFIEDFLVAGTETGLRDAVDASQGDSLADDDAFQDELETAPTGSVATLYADVPAVLDRLVEEGEITERQRAAAEEQVGDALTQPAVAALTAAEDNLAVQAALGAGDSSAPEESPLLRELPGDSWAAFAGDDFGEELTQAFERQGLSELPGFGAFNARLRSLLGVDLTGLTGWIGDVGGYASGTSIFGLGGALILETTDETESANALGAIGRALARNPSLRIEPPSGDEPGFTVSPSDAPVQIVVEQRQGRVVAGLGDSSVDAVLEPAETLADSDVFGAATGALGDDYAAGFLLDFEPVLELLEGVGADDDPEYQAAKPYLDHLDYVVIGAGGEDDRYVTRLVLGLR
jgi:Protein of unknown function (DUF3352)